MQAESLILHKTLSHKWAAGWRYIRGGPGHFFMYVFGRFRVVRSVVVWTYKRRRSRATVTSGTSVIEDVDVDNAAHTVSREGVFAGLRLGSDVLQKLREFASTATCFGEENSKFPFRSDDKSLAEQSYGRKLMVGRFDHALQECPAVRSVASDPKLIAIARNYLGTEPVLLGARIWWSFATGADPAQQMGLGQGFHYDIEGYRSLAFFFYLTDVGPSSGPHVYVRGSHANKPFKALFSLYKGHTDAQVEQWYGAENQVTLCGSAGFGFAEDIFSFHKGTHPQNGDRLILQVRYGLRGYAGKKTY